MSMWYKTKPKSSDPHLYTYDEWTLLTKIVIGGSIFVTFLFALVISGIALSAAWHQQAKAAAAPTAAAAADNSTPNAAQPPAPKPDLFVWLGDVEGLDDPCSASSPASSPAFQIVVDADGIPPRYRHCSGGGDSTLRVSHRGVVLAWGDVSWFCVEGQSEEEGCVDGVVTVQATADDAVLRSVRNDLCVEGEAQFTVEGEVTGLGYLRRETTLLQGNDTESYHCLVQ